MAPKFLETLAPWAQGAGEGGGGLGHLWIRQVPVTESPGLKMNNHHFLEGG